MYFKEHFAVIQFHRNRCIKLQQTLSSLLYRRDYLVYQLMFKRRNKPWKWK